MRILIFMFELCLLSCNPSSRIVCTSEIKIKNTFLQLLRILFCCLVVWLDRMWQLQMKVHTDI